MGDADLAQKYLPHARGVLGKLKSIMPSGVSTAVLRRKVDEGVTVRAAFNYWKPSIEIDVTWHPDQPLFAQADMWIPEGFVFYPASDDSPNGWGLPIKHVNVEGHDSIDRVLAPENLAPGLDVDRWTAGGALGEVLVTRKPDAGYPALSTGTKQTVTYPPLYHPEYGPHPTKKPPQQYGAWKAYRMEFVDFDANAAGITPDVRAERKAWKREMFRLFNERRESIGRDAVSPPIRGDYDSAQATSEWAAATKWFGHSCVGYPVTWRDARDRGMKNGTQAWHDAPVNDHTMGVSATAGGSPVAEILTAMHTSYTFQYVDEAGFDVVIVDGFVPSSAQEAFDAWMSSPPHKATIENTQFDVRPLSASWVQIGYASGASTAHFTNRSQWVQCGNVYWHSAHAEVPTLSWFGFTSKNLYDDTWPVSFAVEFDGAGNHRAAIVGNDSLVSVPDGEGSAHARWYQRLHMPTDESEGAMNQGVLGPYIFARGRTIAIAPDSGYVLAAAIQKRGDHDVQYRLVAICLHRADDPGDVWQGFTPKVRIWWVDLPPHVIATFNGVPTSVIAGNPRTVIRTKYGAEPTEWPWIEANSPYSWRGGDLIDVSSSGLGRPSGDLLSYASMWEFNAEGTKAVCLRYSYDKTLFDWKPIGTLDAFGWASEVIGPGMVGTLSGRSYISLANSGAGIEEFRHIAGTPVFCELTVEFASDNAAMHGVTFWTHNPAGGFVPGAALSGSELDAAHWYINEIPAHYLDNTTGLFYSAAWMWTWPIRVMPIVAYYGNDGSVRAVYDIETNMRSSFVEHWTLDPETSYGQTQDINGNGLSPGVLYRGVASGAAVVNDTACRELLTRAVLYSAEIGHAGVNTIADWPIVLHASDEHLVFAALGVDAPLFTTTAAPPGWPFNPAPFANLYAGQSVDVAPNPSFAPWNAVETSRACIQMDVWHNGAKVHSSRHANPHKFHVHRAWCNPWNKHSRVFWGFKNTVNFAPRWNTAWGLIGGFALDRAGNWALCATFGIQRGTAFFRVGGTDASYTYTNDDGTQYSFQYPNTASATNYNASGPYNMGGFMSSSFADQEQLASMIGVEGANPRSHYVRVV